ncbi:MAG: N-acetylmuramoyl-L-alanine amidase, partial [Bryobacteraceae bacterium]
MVSTAALLLFAAGSPAQTPTPRVQAIRFWCFGDVTRVAIQTQGDYKLISDQIEKPSRLYFDLIGLRPPLTARHGMETIQVGDHRVKQIRLAEVSPKKIRIVFDLQGPAEVISSQLVNPDRLMIEVRPRGTSLPALAKSRRPPVTQYVAPSPVEIASAPASAHTVSAVASLPDAAPVTYPRSTPSPSTSIPSTTIPSTTVSSTTASSTSTPSSITPRPMAISAAKSDAAGVRSLVRVFGLKMGKVVIDAGHGGHDTGTIGSNGLMEKDLVLDVALRLGKMISQQLGSEVVYTRSDDTFIALEDRTRIANQEKA